MSGWHGGADTTCGTDLFQTLTEPVGRRSELVQAADQHSGDVHVLSANGTFSSRFCVWNMSQRYRSVRTMEESMSQNPWHKNKLAADSVISALNIFSCDSMLSRSAALSTLPA
jgi:hypothetical protein